MKIRMLFPLAFAAILFTSTAFANVVENIVDVAGTTIKITAADRAIVVDLGAVTKEEITIKIEDDYGNQLLTEKVRDRPLFVKKYNLSHLEAGKYKLTITKTTSRTVQPFEITDKGVVISEIEQKVKFLPVVHWNGTKLDVNALLSNYSNITVTIIDNEGRTVTQDKNYAVLAFHKRYDMSQLPTGVYVIEVIAGDETFYQTITK